MLQVHDSSAVTPPVEVVVEDLLEVLRSHRLRDTDHLKLDAQFLLRYVQRGVLVKLHWSVSVGSRLSTDICSYGLSFDHN